MPFGHFQGCQNGHVRGVDMTVQHELHITSQSTGVKSELPREFPDSKLVLINASISTSRFPSQCARVSTPTGDIPKGVFPTSQTSPKI